MNARFFRRGLSVFAAFGAAAMLAGAMNQGCVSSQQEEAPAAPEIKPVAASMQEIRTLDFKRKNDADYAV